MDTTPSSSSSSSTSAASGQSTTGSADAMSSSSSVGGASAGPGNTASSSSTVGDQGTTASTTGCTITTPPPTTCTSSIETVSGPPSGTCEEEGNFCEGSYLVGDMRFCTLQPFSAQCCNGVWMSVSRLEDGSVPECPAPREPGSSFSCGDGATSCVVSESYCSATYDPQDNESFACAKLCEEGDCSCFCSPDSFGSCVFEPADGDTLEDGCRCDDDLGAISVECHYHGPIIPAACERDPSSDDICPNPETSGTVYRCTATADDPDPVPRLSCNFSIQDAETSWYCCADE